MSFFTLTIDAAADREDELAALAWDFDCRGTAIFNADAPPAERPPPGRVRVVSYFSSAGAARAALVAARDYDPTLEANIAEAADRNWLEENRKHFFPIHCAPRVWVSPPWHRVEQPLAPGDIEIVIDPGMAFGTGQHPTTALCLEAIDEVCMSPRALLDVGTGSGVLAILAALRGASRVTAIDNDPLAVEAARENFLVNLGLNAVAALPEFVRVEQTPLEQLDGAYDVIVANIVLEPLKQLAPAIARRLAPGGTVLLSGLLDEQAGEAAQVYAALGLRLDATLHREGWTLLRLSS